MWQVLATKPSIWTTLGKAAASIAPAALQVFGLRQQNKMQRSEARRAEAFSERMSSTAAQRSFADYQAAGLNPALAYDRTASSPSGVVGQVQNELGTAFSSAQQAAMNRTALQTMQQQLVKAQADATIASNDAMRSQEMRELFELLKNDGDPSVARSAEYMRRIGSTVGAAVKSEFDAKYAGLQNLEASTSASSAVAEKAGQDAEREKRLNDMFSQMKVGNVNVGQFLLFIKELMKGR